MKNIIFITQKTYNQSLVGEQFIKLVDNSVYLDGNWCCYNSDLEYDDICISMILDNMVYLINNFILSDKFENIVIGWKFTSSMIDKVISHVSSNNYHIYHFILTDTNNARVDNFELINKEYDKNYYVENTSKQMIKESKIDTTELTSFKIAYEMNKIIAK